MYDSPGAIVSSNSLICNDLPAPLTVAGGRVHPICSRMSFTESTSRAPSRMSAWHPRDRPEEIGPGTASTSRFWSSAERAVIGTFLLLSLASGILVYALLTSDFRLAYVAARSNRAMPAVYKFAAWWGGQEGSLLLWSWLLSVYSAIVVFTNRRKFREMMPWVVATLMFTQVFFLTLNVFVEPPFQVLAVGKGVTAVQDDAGFQRVYLALAGVVFLVCATSAFLLQRSRGTPVLNAPAVEVLS